MEKIAVVIVTYNGFKWYDKCFSSLRKSPVPLEVIVVDNASTDNTVSYIKENYPEIHLIESKINLGFGKANNTGMEYALKNNSEYIFLLNQDAWIFPDTIEKLLAVSRQNKEYGIISPVHLIEDEKTPEELFLYYLKSNDSTKNNIDNILSENPEEHLYPVKFVNAALWFISKECLSTIGGFNPIYFHYGEDVDYVNRILYHNFKIGIFPKSRAVHARTVMKRLSVSEGKKRKKHYGPWLTSYQRYFSNINISFSHALGLSFYLFNKEFIRHIFQLNFLSISYDFKIAGQAIANIPAALKNRKISKTKGYSFLNLNK